MEHITTLKHGNGFHSHNMSVAIRAATLLSDFEPLTPTTVRSRRGEVSIVTYSTAASGCKIPCRILRHQEQLSSVIVVREEDSKLMLYVIPLAELEEDSSHFDWQTIQSKACNSVIVDLQQLPPALLKH